MEGLALICTTFSGQTLLSLGYSQKHCARHDSQARGGAWSWYTQLLLAPPALLIQAMLQTKSCYTESCYSSTQHLFGQTGAIMPFSPSSSGHSFSSTCLMSPCLFSTPFSFIFSTRLWKEQICFPLHFLEHKLLPSIFHLKQGGWTGKILLFSLPFSPLYSTRSRSKWVVTRADKGLESRQWL